MEIIERTLLYKKTLLLGVISGLLLIFIFGIIFAPTIFYDNFIWKYFWGPIVSDGLDKSVSYHGVMAAEKFTLISEFVYGGMVLAGLTLLLYILKRWKISIDTNFFIAISPFIIYGTVVRVLEDAHFFKEPLVFWFVTPLVYIQALFIVLLVTFIGVQLYKKTNNLWLTPKKILFYSGICITLPFVYYVILWMMGYQWNGTHGVRSDVFLVVSGLLALIVLSVYAFARHFQRYPSIKVYANFLNLSLILGHMTDGLTTWISIYDPFNMGLPVYVEKHPISDIVMQIWPPLFPIIKFILIVSVIYVFDVLYKKDLEEYPMMKNLLKIGIFILGFAPGLRDLLRVSMGV